MSQFYVDRTNIPSGTLNTLSAEGGSDTNPDNNNFDFSGSSGAILFSTPSDGQMNAAVQVDGSTISINGSNQLQVSSSPKSTASTTGAATETLFTIASSNDTVTTVDLTFSGVMTPTAGGAVEAIGGKMTGVFITKSGSAAQVGTLDITSETSVVVAATISASNSGTDIIIQVVGDASYNIEWSGRIEHLSAP